MAEIALNHPIRIGRKSDDTPNIKSHYEKASATFVRGNFVTLTNGQIDKTADAGTAILGQAMEDASGTANTEILVSEADDGELFEINVYHATEASAVTNKNMIGSEYGIKAVTGVLGDSVHVLDMENTTQKVFRIVRLSSKDNEGDTYGRVIVRICSSALQT